MAVTETGAIYKALEFDGVSSRTFGVYITGEAVYNAPERDVEMVTIPGRNGSFALDKGRFQNITVTYPAGIYADTEEDFAEAISNFRNFLCSRKGYVRLQDEYNPDEYRMAIYSSGLEVDNAQHRAGQFNIVFDCQPQRWLTSGEEAVSVESGDELTNPTLFEASPMLLVEQYGDIVVGGETISIESLPLGEIQLSSLVSTASSTLSVVNLNTGDSIYPKTATSYPRVNIRFKGSGITSAQVRNATNAAASISGLSSTSFTLKTDVLLPVHFVKGTSSTITSTVTVRVNGTTDFTATITTAYNGSDTITLSRSVSGLPSSFEISLTTYSNPIYYGDSTKVAFPQPLYIDLAIGEAYGDVSGEFMNLNNVVTIPPELPKLAVGDTEITYDNTITSLEVIPRWWKI